MSIQKLPTELLNYVLNAVDKIQYLTQCRLVRKRWSKLAEKLMFGKRITLKSEKTISQLLYHSEKIPNNGKLIKYLDTVYSKSEHTLFSITNLMLDAF